MAELVDGLQQPLPYQRPILRIDAQQDKTWNGLAATKHKLAEMVVSCGEKTPFPRRQHDDLHVAQTGSKFGDVKHVVTGAAQFSNQRDRDALVREPARFSDK